MMNVALSSHPYEESIKFVCDCLGHYLHLVYDMKMMESTSTITSVRALS